MEAAVKGDNARGVLTAVLDGKKPLVDLAHDIL